MVKNNVGYGCLIAGIVMLSVSVLTKSFAALLLSLALMAFSPFFFFNRAKSIALAAGFTLASIGVAEIIMSFALPIQLDPERGTTFDASSDYANQYFTRSEDLGSLARPGVHSSRKRASNGELIYDVRYSIGADGFRMTPYADPDRDDTKRINFFGGSFTFGEGLNDDETLPYLVASTMEIVSVKNYGFHGYGPHQALAILQSDRDTRGAVNFFVTAPWHAQRAACVPSYSTGAPKFVLASDTRVVRDGECKFVPEEESKLQATIKKVLNHSSLYRASQALTPNRSQDAEMELYFAIIAEMARLSRSRGQSFIVGYVKAEDDYLRGTYSNEVIFEKLKRLSDDIVDLTLSEKVESLAPEYYIHELDRHPSALANKQRAQRVSHVLVKVIGAGGNFITSKVIGAGGNFT